MSKKRPITKCQRAVLAELDRRNWRPAALVMLCIDREIVGYSAAYEWLRGEMDLGVGRVERILAALDLELIIEPAEKK